MDLIPKKFFEEFMTFGLELDVGGSSKSKMSTSGIGSLQYKIGENSVEVDVN